MVTILVTRQQRLRKNIPVAKAAEKNMDCSFENILNLVFSFKKSKKKINK
jgi:hypothetical protein